MNILMIHNRYRIRAGEDCSFDAESLLLEKYGDTVLRYTCDNKDIEGKIYSKVKLALRTIWSHTDYKAVRQILQKERVDVVHVQNHFPLISPSVYYAAKTEGIPVVQSLRNYRLFCLNAYLFREGKVCEDCLSCFTPWLGVMRKCYRGSWFASLVLWISLSLHRLVGTYSRKVDVFIALTEFARHKYAQNGIPREKIFVKPNFAPPSPANLEKDTEGLLFVGRLSSEKGISVLIDAWKELESFAELTIIGEGPLETLVREAANTMPGVVYLGRKSTEEVQDIMRKSKALIFPSLWYEGMPRVIIESFAAGTPVIASDLGAMSTMITHRADGLHFEPGNHIALVEQIRWMMTNPTKWELIRQKSRCQFKANYAEQSNYQVLTDIYKHALGCM